MNFYILSRALVSKQTLLRVKFSMELVKIFPHKANCMVYVCHKCCLLRLWIRQCAMDYNHGCYSPNDPNVSLLAFTV